MESINLEEYVKSLPRHELLYMDKIYYEKRRKDQIYPFRMYHGHKDEKSELTFHPKVNKKSKRLYKKRFLRTAEKMEKVVGGSEVKSKKRRSRADRKGVQHCVIEMRRSEVFDEEDASSEDNRHLRAHSMEISDGNYRFELDLTKEIRESNDGILKKITLIDPTYNLKSTQRQPKTPLPVLSQDPPS